MSAADRLIERLQRVKKAGEGRWMCQCPGHEDRSASLSIREVQDGRVLIHCFAGCETAVVLAQLGLRLSDLFAEPISTHLAPLRDRSHWHGQRAAIDAVRSEVDLILIAASDIAAGRPLSQADAHRVSQAAAAVREAKKVLYGR
jgi:hypothetical protein